MCARVARVPLERLQNGHEVSRSALGTCARAQDALPTPLACVARLFAAFGGVADADREVADADLLYTWVMSLPLVTGCGSSGSPSARIDILGHSGRRVSWDPHELDGPSR